MKIYKPIEPQPEIELVTYKDEYCLESVAFKSPYKIGDEIDMSGRYEHRLFLVKSIKPVNRDGVWSWEIEVE